jgi:hypothetical protein
MDDARVSADFTAMDFTAMKRWETMVFPRIGFLRATSLNHLYHHRGKTLGVIALRSF